MTPHYEDPHLTVWLGDTRAALAAMPAESVDCIITSPPYYSLRDYGIEPVVWQDQSDPLTHVHEWGERIVERATNHTDKRRWQHTRNGRDEEQPTEKRVAWLRSDIGQGAFCACGAWRGQLGLEPDPLMFIGHIVEVFRAARRVLRKNGTLWLNMGDSYAAKTRSPNAGGSYQGDRRSYREGRPARAYGPDVGFKNKDRMMIPARVAIALQEDGWWLRDEIVWAKPNPMPSSVEDRTTPAHEMVYLLTKAARYHYDAAAIREATTGPDDERNRFGARLDVGLPQGKTPDRRRNRPRVKVPGGWDVAPGAHGTVHRSGRTVATYRESALPGQVSDSTERQRVGLNARWDASEANGAAPAGRNKRSVWTVATEPYPEAHFATFPTKLIEPMILAGCPPGGVVLDCFGGSGTVAVVAQRLGRKAALIDLSPEYVEQMIRRVAAARGAGDGPAVDMPVPFAADGLWAAEG